jgi:small subunit ribosomal protein S35
MGESHPAENKVVLEFCIGDLPLTHAQRLKLVKLAGVRYDPQSDIVKMSCEMFDTIAQNKRYLGDLVDTLMATAKGEGDAEGAKDTFEDVPVDFRHVKWKKVPEFPEEWKLTDKRMAEIEQKRIERAEKEQQRLEEGQLVDGSHIIERAARMPVMAPAGAAKLGGGRGSQRVSSVR